MNKLHPMTDIHLLRGMSVTFDFLFNDERTPLNDWRRASGFDFALPAGFTLATMSGLTLTASATTTGRERTWLIMRSPAGGAAASTIPVRVSVHQTLHRLWCSAANLRLENSPVGVTPVRNDRILVVYAEFEDASGGRVIVDVTGRDFLTYTPSVGPGFAIAADGRVTTTAATGITTVTIGVAAGLGITPTTGRVTLEVVPAPADLPILRQHHQGMDVTKRSLLFLAEGFTAPTEQEFHDLCKLLTLRLKKVEPYARLAESLDVYGAFFPSAEEGVSLGADMVQPTSGAPAYVLFPDDSFFPRVLSRVGHPAAPAAPTFPDLAAFVAAAGGAINARNRQMWQQTFDVWKELPAAQPSRVRDTAFGLTLTYPHGGPYTPELFPPVPPPEAIWLRQSVESRRPARTPFFPDHRLPPLLGTPPIDPASAHLPSLHALLRKLRPPDGPANFGARWLPGGDSDGLVVFLCRSDLYGGVAVSGSIFVSTGNQVTVGVAPSSITPPPPFRALLDVVVGITSSYTKRPIMELTDVLAHELGHSAALGALDDEYGGQVYSPLPAAAVQKISAKPNSEELSNVQGVGHGVDADLLKWRWPRAESGAVVEDCFVSGSEVSFVVNLSHALRWTQRTGPAPVWVRHGPLWQENAPVGPVRRNPLQLELVSFDPVSQIVRCKPLGTTTAADVVASFWTLLSVGGATPDVRIVLQRRDAAGTPLWLISPAVATELANGPLTTNACHPLGVTDHTARVAGLRNSTPAAYEGGSGINCLVLRPSRACKLSRRMEEVPGFLGVFTRLRAEAFCAVCQYVLTHQLDVSLLPDVDRLL